MKALEADQLGGGSAPVLGRTRFLASVTSADEARLAMRNGADIIDAKDPARGALGALPAAVVGAIRSAAPRPALVSATIGDLPAEPGPVVEAAAAIAATGVDFVKIGIFPGGSPLKTVAALGRTPMGQARIVGLLLADAEPDFELIDLMAAAGFAGVMLDTAEKSTTSLMTALAHDRLAVFVRHAQECGLFAGLAGSLRLSDVPTLMRLKPDVLGFRGALCADGLRTRPLAATAVSRVRTEIDRVAAAGTRPAMGDRSPAPATDEERDGR